jgi:ferrous iron transport protein A
MVKIIQRDNVLQGFDKAPVPAGSEVTLDALAPGQSASISHLSAGPALKLHLMELGFVAGSPITFLMTTPFGDPHIFSLRGTSIALRKSEARCIHVRT